MAKTDFNIRIGVLFEGIFKSIRGLGKERPMGMFKDGLTAVRALAPGFIADWNKKMEQRKTAGEFYRAGAGGGPQLEYDQMIKGAEELGKKQKNLTEYFKESEKAAGRLGREFRVTAEKTEGFIDKVVRLGGKLRSVSRLFFYASLDLQQFANVILNPMRAGLAIFEDYNKTMTQMWVNFEAIRGTGDRSLALLQQRFIEVAEATEFSRLELAQAAAVFGTAGIAAEEISASLEDLAALARIGFTDMSAVATVTLRTMRRFQMSLEDAKTEMWRLAMISQYTGESLTNIASQMGYAIEMGQELGYTFAEIAAGTTILTELYGSSSIAGRRQANVYARLIEVGEEYGIQLRDLSGEMLTQRDHLAGLADYLDLIGAPLEQNQYLMSLFGKTGAATARALVDAFKAGRLDEIMEDTGDAMIDTMRELSTTIKDEFYVGMQDLRAGVNDLNLTIGEKLAPTITNVIGPITDALNKFATWVSVNEELIVTVGTLAVAASALAIAIRTAGFAIEIVVAVSHILVAVGAALKFVFTGIMIGSAMAGGGMAGLAAGIWGAVVALAAFIAPILLVIAVIIILVGLVMGITDAIKEYSDESTALGRLLINLGGVLKVFGGIIAIIIYLIQKLVEGLFMIGYVIGKVVIPVIDLIVQLLENLFNLITGNPLKELIFDLGLVESEAHDLSKTLRGRSPSIADRFFELGDAIRGTLNPMQQATMWGRRLNNAVGNVSAEMTLGYGRATAGALMAGAGGGDQPVTIYIDGAYIQDPNELAEIMAERQTRLSRRHFRRTPY